MYLPCTYRIIAVRKQNVHSMTYLDALKWHALSTVYLFRSLDAYFARYLDDIYLEVVWCNFY